MSRSPTLYIAEILAWADAHHARTGKWPIKSSGRIQDAPRVETWAAIDASLVQGCRGLRPKGSLARLLEKHRGVRNKKHLPTPTPTQIIIWAKKHRQRNGKWPTANSGPIHGTNGETWSGVDAALQTGIRGCMGGSSLAKLLESKLGVKNRMNLPPLSEAKIVAWADLHHQKTGDWPTINSGLVYGSRGETWCAIAIALAHGHRGLPGGSSLAKLLRTRRRVVRYKRGRQLSTEIVLNWAKSHFQRTGRLPSAASGPVFGIPGETWGALQAALLNGYRGLPKGTTLAKFLAPLKREIARSGARNSAKLLPLTEARILAWADLHYQRTGDWPKVLSGAVVGSGGESWSAIQSALCVGLRGLPGGSSLAKLLATHREVTAHRRGRQLSVATILEWAEAHYRRTGDFPHSNSGSVHGNPGQTWGALQMSLLKGYRGLPSGTSLAKVLAPLKEKMAKAGRR
jgi:hypothetical protein